MLHTTYQIIIYTNNSHIVYLNCQKWNVYGLQCCSNISNTNYNAAQGIKFDMVRGWISRILKIHRIFRYTRFVGKGMANIEGTYFILYLAVSAESGDITGLYQN